MRQGTLLDLNLVFKKNGGRKVAEIRLKGDLKCWRLESPIAKIKLKGDLKCWRIEVLKTWISFRQNKTETRLVNMALRLRPRPKIRRRLKIQLRLWFRPRFKEKLRNTCEFTCDIFPLVPSSSIYSLSSTASLSPTPLESFQSKRLLKPKKWTFLRFRA